MRSIPIDLEGSGAIIDSSMAQLIVRQIEAKIVRKLKERAGRHGISMEEEHRRILRDILLGSREKKQSLKEYLLAMPEIGSDELFERTGDFGRNIDV